MWASPARLSLLSIIAFEYHHLVRPHLGHIVPLMLLLLSGVAHNVISRLNAAPELSESDLIVRNWDGRCIADG